MSQREAWDTDLMVFGTSNSNLRLIMGLDIFQRKGQGKEIEVSVITDENDTFTSSITLDEMPLPICSGLGTVLKTILHRLLFFEAVNTIFHATGFNPIFQSYFLRLWRDQPFRTILC
jgi:hypothetical protein